MFYSCKLRIYECILCPVAFLSAFKVFVYTYDSDFIVGVPLRQDICELPYYSGAHHSYSPVIKLGFRHPRKKQRKEEPSKSRVRPPWLARGHPGTVTCDDSPILV